MQLLFEQLHNLLFEQLHNLLQRERSQVPIQIILAEDTLEIVGTGRMCAEGILRHADLVVRRLPRAAKVRHQSTGSVQAFYWGLANALEKI